MRRGRGGNEEKNPRTTLGGEVEEEEEERAGGGTKQQEGEDTGGSTAETLNQTCGNHKTNPHLSARGGAGPQFHTKTPTQTEIGSDSGK